MSNVTGDIKKLFNFKYKTRNDSVTDQFNRVFMVKAMLVAAFLTGMNWYKDDIKCIVPKHMDTSSIAGFGGQACWINGFYVYEQLRHKENFHGYYGIPMDLNHNGTDNYGKTCEAAPGKSDCKAMEKKFYLQYQWFPFYIAMLAVLYYAPYIMFGYVNNDLITLRKTIKNQKANVEDIVANYFPAKANPRNNFRVVLNIGVKLVYLFVNVFAFLATDSVLNGEFRGFGNSWVNWSKLTNSEAHNYLGIREFLKPGEVLLPTFGFCDVLELGQDVKYGLTNDYHLMCEISQHVLYHYVLIAIWFAMIFGIVASVVGFIELLIRMALRSFFFAKEEEAAMKVFKHLPIRQQEYLDFVRKKNVPVYGKLIRVLYHSRFGGDSGSSKADTSSEIAETGLN